MAENTATLDEVRQFLTRFKEVSRCGRIVYINEERKNTETLAKLDIRPCDRTQLILELEPPDYYQGPDQNHYPGLPEVWMFGKEIKGHEVYIKICMGREGTLTSMCISFHIADYRIFYPLKSKLQL